MKEKSYFMSLISLSILFIILSQAFFGIGTYRVNTQKIEDEETADDLALCPTCPLMSEKHLTNSGEKRRIGTDVDKLEKIKKAISKKGAKWVAGETQVSKYNFEEQKRLVGAKFKSIPVEEKRLIAPLGFELVGSFDWRDVNGFDWMTPVRNQGSCGSCWAFGTTGSMEAVINIVYDDPTIDMDLSEQTLISCSGCGDCDGGYPYSTYNYIKDTGIPDEACFPYKAANAPCDICPDWIERAWYITDFKYVSNDPYSIKWALQTYGPLGVAMYAPDDFLYYMSGIYEPVYVSPEWNNTFPFGSINHWVTLVGYNDVEEYWIVKNSWGWWWGSWGYGKIAYGVLEEHNYILAITSVEGPIGDEHNLAVSVQAPPYILSGTDYVLDATVYNNGLNDETEVEIFLMVNGTIVNSLNIASLPAGFSESISSPWTPTISGWYNITAYSPPVSGEEYDIDNIDTKWTVVPRGVLLVVDDDGDFAALYGTSKEEFESALTYAGLDYVVWSESIHGRPSLEFLNTFELVIWTCGDFWEYAVDSIDAGNLIYYVNQGGNLLLEGEDIGYDHDSDEFMINVAHAIFQVDDAGALSLTVTDPSHPLVEGLSTTLNWLIEPPFGDGVTPINDGIEVIQYSGTNYAAVTAYKGQIGGSVVYYSFPLYCLYEAEADRLVINSINWLKGGFEHELSVSLDAPIYLLPGDDSVLNITVYNEGQAEEVDVEVQLFINGTEVMSEVIPVLANGTFSNLSYSWTPSPGLYDIIVYVQPVPGESSTSNNIASTSVDVSTSPRHIGDIILKDDDLFIIEDVYFTQKGNVFILDNATLIIRNATLNLEQADWYQYQISVNCSANLRTEEAYIISDGYFDTLLGGLSQGYFNSTYFGYEGSIPPTDSIGFIIIEDDAVLTVDNSTLNYLLCFDESTVSVSDSTLYSLYCYDGSMAVVSTSYVVWTVYVSPWGDSEVSLIDTSVNVVGIGFSGDNNVLLTDLNSGVYGFWNIHVNETVSGVNWNLTLEDTEIRESWFLMCWDNSEASIHNSTLESLDCFDGSVVSVYDSTLSYLYCYDNSLVSVNGSDIILLYVSPYDASDVSLTGCTVGYPMLSFRGPFAGNKGLYEEAWESTNKKMRTDERRRDDFKATWGELEPKLRKYLEEDFDCKQDSSWMRQSLMDRILLYKPNFDEESSKPYSATIVSLKNLNPMFYNFWNIHVNETVSGVNWNMTFLNTEVTKGWDLSCLGDSVVSVYDSTLSYLYCYDESSVSVYDSTIYGLGCSWFSGFLFFDEIFVEGWWDIYYSQFYLEGNVNFTDSNLWFFDSTVTRNYGVKVRDLGAPAPGVALTLYDEEETPIWGGLTDSSGLCNFNMTLNDDDYTTIHSLRTDYYPEERDVSLISKTPILIHISSHTMITSIEDIYGNPISGGVKGDTVVVKGSGIAAGVTVSLYWDAVKAWDGEKGLLNSTEAKANGEFEVWFDVPEAVEGVHYIWVKDTSTGETEGASFNVSPSIELDFENGPVGTVVTVSGNGFTANGFVDTITLNGAFCTKMDTIEISATGTFTGSFVIPGVENLDMHEITLTDNNGLEANNDFLITGLADISLNPEYGVQGATVEISGENFTAISGKSVTLELWNKELTTKIVDIKTLYTNSNGEFNGSFTIPAVSSGTYRIVATQDNYKINASKDFRVGLMIVVISPSQGPTGAKVTLTGTGFTENERWNATFGEVVIFYNETVDADGNIYGLFHVPMVDEGEYTIIVLDILTGIEVSVEFVVTNKTTVNIYPVRAPNEYNVTIEGLYFTAEEGTGLQFLMYNTTDEGDITDEWVMNVYQGSPGIAAVTDKNGGFTAWWIVPDNKTIGSGDYTINVTDVNGFFTQKKFMVGTNITVSIGSAIIAPGYTTEVPVNMSQVTKISGLGFELYWNPAVVSNKGIRLSDNFSPSTNFLTVSINKVLGKATVALVNTHTPDYLTWDEDRPVLIVEIEAIGLPGNYSLLDFEGVEVTDAETWIPLKVSNVEDGMVTIQNLGDIHGYVTYSYNGAPMEGATVELLKDEFTVNTTVTDVAGEYEFHNLQLGEYNLTANHDRVQVDSQYNTFWATSKTIEIIPGETIEVGLSLRIRGDLNDNGGVDIGDVAKTANMYVGNISEEIGLTDFNGNGELDIGDVAKLANYYVENIDEA